MSPDAVPRWRESQERWERIDADALWDLLITCGLVVLLIAGAAAVAVLVIAVGAAR